MTKDEAATIRKRVGDTVGRSSVGPVHRAAAEILFKLDAYPDAVAVEPELAELALLVDAYSARPTMTLAERDACLARNEKATERARAARRVREEQEQERARSGLSARCDRCGVVVLGRYCGTIPASETHGLPPAPETWTRIISITGAEPETHLCAKCAEREGLPRGPIHPDAVAARL